MNNLLIQASFETIYMSLVSTILAFAFGLPLGVLDYITKKGNMLENKALHTISEFVINVGRSIPFIILFFWMIPVTRVIVGTSIGTSAGIVPLTVAAIPFCARLIENGFNEIDISLIESVQCMGATKFQIIKDVMIREKIPTILRGVSITLITLIGYSAMAGTFGAGGLGSVAIIYGYQQYNNQIMLITVILLVVIVQIFQKGFDFVIKKIDKSI